VNTAPFPQLQAFLAVARQRSFSAAARELGVSRSAVSQAVRQLEKTAARGLAARTTRSVSLTDAGRRLVDGAGPSLAQVMAALTEVSAQPGETVGRVRLTVPRSAVPLVIEPVLPTFRQRHPRIEVEVIVEERFVDIVAEGYDAGVRLSESIERDMVQVRLTDPSRFVVVGRLVTSHAKARPRAPKICCATNASPSARRPARRFTLGSWNAGRRNWRVPVRGGVVSSDSRLTISLAERGLGLAYAFEPMVLEQLRSGRLELVLERYAAVVSGFFLYFPSVARRSEPLRLFIETAQRAGSARRDIAFTRCRSDAEVRAGAGVVVVVVVVQRDVELTARVLHGPSVSAVGRLDFFDGAAVADDADLVEPLAGGASFGTAPLKGDGRLRARPCRSSAASLRSRWPHRESALPKGR